MVLVAGGFNLGGGFLASAELYDPSTGNFTATGAMTTSHAFHTATLLGDGKVLIVGGVCGGYGPCSTAEIYDPATQEFTATGALGTPRLDHTATLLANGKVLTSGGFGGACGVAYAVTRRQNPSRDVAAGGGGTGPFGCPPIASAELYDPSTGLFTATGALATPRAWHTATLLGNGTVLITGGYSTSGLLASAELYDPTAGTFGATGSMSAGRYLHAATLLGNGKVLISGSGNYPYVNADLYDPSSDAFSPTGNMVNPHTDYHTSTLLADGRVLIAGGGDTGNNPSVAADLYSPFAPTTTSLTPSATSLVFGQALTLKATVNPVPPTTGTPTGSVTFSDGSTVLGTDTLSGGQALLTTSALSAGLHSIAVVYGGDVNFDKSASAVAQVTVNQATSTILLAPSVNPSKVNQPVTFTATITPRFGGAATGSVSFFDDVTLLGTVPVTSNSAGFTTATLTAGLHGSIQGVYSGDSNVLISISSDLSLRVNKFATTTALTSSLNPSTYGQPVTLTATVTPAGPNTPTGTVSFKHGAINLATVALSGGVATLTTANFGPGTLSIAAVYNGDAVSAMSMSPALSQVVDKAVTTTTIVSSLNPSKRGKSVKFTATVSSSTIKPTGTVTFAAGATVLGTASLAGGKASVATSTLPKGSTSVTATYNGTANVTGSSGSVAQVVN
jgi:hypothetical protein